jgi:hypothetical protein
MRPLPAHARLLSELIALGARQRSKQVCGKSRRAQGDHHA